MVSLWRRRPLFVITVCWNVLRLPRAINSDYRTDPDRARLLSILLDGQGGIRKNIYCVVGKKIVGRKCKVSLEYSKQVLLIINEIPSQVFGTNFGRKDCRK